MGAERHFLSHGEEATEALGAELGARCEAGTVLALTGDLGAGKTCLVRGLARGLGIEEGVASPSYTLMQAHEGGRLPLYHFDAWMEGREKAWLAEGGGTWLRAEGVAVVEWAGRVDEWLPLPRIEIQIAHLGPQERLLTLRIVGDPEDAEGALAGLLEGLACPEGIVEQVPGPDLPTQNPPGA